MSKLIRSPEALRDLDEIWRYIAPENPAAADRVIDAIAAKCFLLAANPDMGEKRTDLGEDFRCFSVGNYVIFFHPTSEGVEILRVLHGARDSKSEF